MTNYVLLDADGVISPFKLLNPDYQEMKTVGIPELGESFEMVFDTRFSDWLDELRFITCCNYMWVSSWNPYKINERIGSAAGIPRIPVMDLGHKKFSQSIEDWKFQGVFDWWLTLDSDDKIVWFDDEPVIKRYVKNSHYYAPTSSDMNNVHVVTVDPVMGLTDADISEAIDFFLPC